MKAVVLVMSFCICFFTAYAQEIWMPQQSGSFLSAEYFSQSPSDYNDAEIQTAVVTGAVLLKNGDRIKFDLPMVWTPQSASTQFYPVPDDVHLSSSNEKSNGIGNFSCSYEIIKPGGNVSYEIGMRFPTAPENLFSSIIGTCADFDRFEMYIPDCLTLFFMKRIRKETDRYFLTTCLGESASMRTGPSSGSDKYLLFFSGSIHGGIKIQNFSIGAGCSARFLVWELPVIVSQIGAIASVKMGQFQPNIFYRVPIGFISENGLSFNGKNSIFGLGLTYNFN